MGGHAGGSVAVASKPEPAIAADLREVVELAIKRGAVAALLVYETADGRCVRASVPNLIAVREGLLKVATWPTE
jgi:hypothetical protein